jgi:hypothetical protein
MVQTEFIFVASVVSLLFVLCLDSRGSIGRILFLTAADVRLAWNVSPETNLAGYSTATDYVATNLLVIARRAISMQSWLVSLATARLRCSHCCPHRTNVVFK